MKAKKDIESIESFRTFLALMLYGFNALRHFIYIDGTGNAEQNSLT
jgi:hypothetical protein